MCCDSFKYNSGKRNYPHILRAGILTRNKIDPGKIRLTYLGNDERFPAKGIELRWANFSKTLTPGNRIFALDFYREGHKIYTKRLKFLLETKQTVAFAIKDIAKGQTITKQDYEVRDEFLPDLVTDVYVNEVEGYTSLVGIQTGSIIRKKQVREIYPVEKGSEVEVSFRSGALVVTGRAIAMKSARVGERIVLRSTSNGLLLQARVSDRSRTVVE
jgi:flagella basal body P-ring formation protein FlgA